MKSRVGLFLILISAVRLMAQPPDISYSQYRFFVKNSVVQPLLPVNTGGPVPARMYSETTSFAGTGERDFKDGQLNKAAFNYPSALALDDSGNIYIADEKNNSIRKITREGIVSTIASKGFNGPSGISVDGSGNIYVADTYNHVIKRIQPSGAVSIFAGNGKEGDADNKGTLAMFSYPVSIAVDKAGIVYVSDEGNNKIRKITTEGVVSTFAGDGLAGSEDHTNGKLARFRQPNGLALDAAGNLYVADQLNHKIRKITPQGSVSTYAGTGTSGSANSGAAVLASFNNPRGIVADSIGNLYVADVGNQQIRKISPDGEVNTLAGSGSPGSSDNPDGRLANFYFPNDLAIDRSGIMYVADCLNNKIRKIELTGYQISPGILPEGLQFDRKTGAFSGTPRQFSAGSAYHITAHNAYGSSTTTLEIAVSGQPGNALSFDAFDDGVILPDNPGLTPETVTAEIWVNIDVADSGAVRFLLKRNAMGSHDDSYSLRIYHNGKFRAEMASGTGLAEGHIVAESKVKAMPRRWYFLAGVFTRDSLSLYVDGELQETVPTGFPISTGPNSFHLGFVGAKGFLADEVRVFSTDRSAYIRSDMLNPVSPETNGLILYYNFNSGTPGGENVRFNKLFDLTANGNHGSLQNFLTLSGDNSNWVESYAMVVPVIQEATGVSATGFTAKWLKPGVGIAENYYLDVSESPLFETYTEGYSSRSVKETSTFVSGLKPGTTYYYRVRANKRSVEGQGAYSATMAVKTL